MENKILPSTKLLSVNVHKLQGTSCPRYYFWYWILNLVSKRFNINFWYGSVLGEGVEVLMKTKDLKMAHKAMILKNDELLKNELVLPDSKEEIELQFQMLLIIVAAWSKVANVYIKSIKVNNTELKFEIPLASSPVLFTGTVDAEGTISGSPVLFEIKTASSMSITDDYFAHLKFDKQINGYAVGIKTDKKITFKECNYLVFRKPQIRVKQSETVEEFLNRLEVDLIERADWYFITYKHRFGKKTTADVLHDIEGITFDLYSKYNYFTEEELLNPYNWPRNDRQCFNYGICAYFNLCKDCSKYPLFLKMYRQRDMRYDLENKELGKKPVNSNWKQILKRS